MNPILQLPPTLPPHKVAPAAKLPTHILAEWPVGSFLENLVVLDDQSIVVSVLSEARLDRVSPTGEITVLTQFTAPPTGIFLHDGALYVAVGEPGEPDPQLYRVNPVTGVASPWMTLTGMVFANGVTSFDEGRFLYADSWLGSLFLVDVQHKVVTRWIQHELLTRATGIDFLPGANGVKRYRDEVTVSSNGRALLLRIPVNPDGSAGEIETIAEQLRVDDFAYDEHGDLYLTTHIGHSVDKLSRNGTRVTLAGAEEGLAGSTACAFGREASSATSLFVTTTGGIVTPPGGVLQPARVVRIEVGQTGYQAGDKGASQGTTL